MKITEVKYIPDDHADGKIGQMCYGHQSVTHSESEVTKRHESREAGVSEIKAGGSSLT
jgi:GMP synthase-like glutamine amidotransferase